MRRAYFQYYETFEKIVQKFKTAEERENFRAKVIEYGLYGTAPEDLNPLEEMVWDVIKDLIDDQLHRREVNKANREEREKKRRDKRDEMQQAPEDEEDQEEPAPLGESEIENIKLEAENGMTAAQIAATHGRPVAEIKKFMPKVQKFKKPTLDEVKGYCQERGSIVDAQQFLDFYESKGWKVGGAQMRDWKAAVRTWESRRTAAPKQAAGQSPYRQLPEDRLTL